MHSGEPALIDLVRTAIREDGPVPFRWFMEQALYHPGHGYYSSGRAAIGRAGDYFTNVSVGPIYGRLLTAQFREIWERLGKPTPFDLIEQGAHDGRFARDVLENASTRHPEFFAATTYRIVEPFPVLQQRQENELAEFGEKVRWLDDVSHLDPFVGVHFSNELLDAMPVHLVRASAGEWKESYVADNGRDFEFQEGAPSSTQLESALRDLPVPASPYETEVNLAALDWLEKVSAKIKRGYILLADYGHSRAEFFAPERAKGTLLCRSRHQLLESPLCEIGRADITSHVEWTTLAKRAEEGGLAVNGFADQHHFVAGLLARFSEDDFGLESPAARRGLQTLLHPDLLGRSFQFLCLEKGLADSPLSGFHLSPKFRSQLDLTD